MVLNGHFTFVTMIILHILLINSIAFYRVTYFAVFALTSYVNLVQWTQVYYLNVQYITQLYKILTAYK